jgi:uncharacterized protein YhaN
MKLIECYIENFGKLSDFKLSFSKGLNTVKKNNGYGKTTLTVFIKSMLFGLDTSRRQKLELNDRKHYMPWQGGRCGGYLIFEANGKKYRVERTFMPKAADDVFKLYDEKSGRECDDFTENLGEELFGIDVDGFERTVFLSEANLAGKNENKTVSAKLSNLVGYDGDLSAMDDAIELLEKQRKVYRKKGGSGEIGDMKLKYSETERRIFDLERKKGEYRAEETKLSELTCRLNKLREERGALTALMKKADEARIKNAYTKQYADMRSSLSQDLARKEELDLFFKNGCPTHAKINEMRSEFYQSKRVSTTNAYTESPEMTALSEFFKNEVADEEFENAKIYAELLSERKKEAEAAKERLIDARDKQKQNKPPIAGSLLFPGIFISCLAALLAVIIHPFVALAAVLGIIMVLVSFLRKKSFEKQKAADENAVEIFKKEYLAIEGDVCMTEERINEFLLHFPYTGKTNVTEAVADVLRKRDIYVALCDSHKALYDKEREIAEKAKAAENNAKAFLALFPTVTDEPFDEITKNVIEYQALVATVERCKLTMQQFARQHGISAESDAAEIQPTDTAALNVKAEELDEAISAAEREKTLLERRLSELYDEIDTIGELKAEKDQLAENIDALEKKLNVILKTEDLLNEAKDLLTAKYLSKTKAAFDKYIDLIGKESADDFSMNTSFELMKNERGAYRDAESYSKGTKDLYALAIRLALIDSLYEGESPFVILDDPFAHFDDLRLSGALSVLSALAKEKQIIYLTCAESRSV